METEELVKRLRTLARTETYLREYDRRCREAMTDAANSLQELTPKHDPAITEEIKFLDRIINRFLEPADRQMAARIAIRLGDMNPPAPVKPYTKLRTEAYRLLSHSETETPENRAKLEAAIKILGEK